MKKTWSFLFVLATIGLSGQDIQGQSFPTDDAVIQQMWDEGMGSRSQVVNLAQALLDSIGPRLMGSPGFDAAGDWLISNYTAWGVSAERQVYGTWTGWDRGYTHLDLVAPRKRTLEGTILAWSPGTEGPIEGEVIVPPLFANSDEFEAWLPQVDGRIVAISLAEPTCREDQSWLDHATQESFQALNAARDEARQAFGMSTRAMGPGAPERIAAAGAIAVLTGR